MSSTLFERKGVDIRLPLPHHGTAHLSASILPVLPHSSSRKCHPTSPLSAEVEREDTNDEGVGTIAA
ncbi:hypothetical protein HMPREF9004_1421 [Schaalia cardiffensis F0333]|uniref:Uncharacterized protein n=1 Tax=Schaalia cardiffensis F0333 TaxID=888050 RepID=N6X136_9ACTO|nr:hypothetical protein HMPREF9004_1421 [Schaalia cardiffensis F0333]